MRWRCVWWLGLALWGASAWAGTWQASALTTTTGVANPLRGLHAWRNEAVAKQVVLDQSPLDHYHRMPWVELEPSLGNYSGIDTVLEPRIAAAAAAGRRFAFRVQGMKGYGDTRSYLPVDARPATGDFVPIHQRGFMGDSDRNGTAETFVPDWNDEGVLAAMEGLFAELGRRHAHDRRVAWVDIGWYGQWGEWTIDSDVYVGISTYQDITQSNKERVIRAHTQAFPSQQLVLFGLYRNKAALQYAFGLNSTRPIGLRFDCFGKATFFKQWTDRPSEMALVTERWRVAPMVGESCGESTNTAEAAQAMIDQARWLHLSTLGNGNFYGLNTDPVGGPRLQALAKLLGFSLLPEHVTVADQAEPGTGLSIQSVWRNDGTAPLYETFTLKWRLVPVAGGDAQSMASTLDLRQVLPEASLTHSETLALPANLSPGDYTLELVAEDDGSAPRRAPLRFMASGQRDDGTLVVGSVRIVLAAQPQAALIVHATSTTPSYGSTVALSISGASGTGAVTYASNNASCTISGNILTAAAVGSCTVTATKAAAESYPVATAQLTITVAKAAQTLVLFTPGSLQEGGTVQLGAQGGASGNPVLFASATAQDCSVSSAGMVSGLRAGSLNCEIVVTQAGNANYQDATPASTRFSVAATSGSFSLADGETRQLLGVGQVSLGRGSTLILGSASAGSSLQLPIPPASAQLVVGGQTLTVSAGGRLGVGSAMVNGQSLAIPRLDSGCLDLNAPASASALLVGSGNSANVLTAGLGEAQLHACLDTSTRSTSVHTRSGSLLLACPAGGRCASGQDSLELLSGEVAVLGSDGSVSELQLGNAPGNNGQAVGDALRTQGLLPASLTLEKAPARLQGSTPARLGQESLQTHLASALATAHEQWGAWQATQPHTLGGYSMQFGNGRVSFMAQLPIRVNLALPDGITTLPDGSLQVVFKGLVLQLRAVVHDIVAFGQDLQNMPTPLAMSLREDGSLRLGLGGLLLVAQPELFSATPNLGASVVNGIDLTQGKLRHVSGQGAQRQAQHLNAAAYNTNALSAALRKLDANSTLSTQADHSVRVRFLGNDYLLRPDYWVRTNNSGNGAELEVRGGMLFMHYPFGFSQGFGVGLP